MWRADGDAVVAFSGKDAGSWLQSQTTNDIQALEPGQGHVNCSLDRTGKLRAVFTLHRWADRYYAVVDRACVDQWLTDLESRLIQEDVTFGVEEFEHLVLQGPWSVRVLASLLTPPLTGPYDLFPRRPHSVRALRIGVSDVLVLQASPSGEDGFRLLCAPGEGEQIYRLLRDAGAEDVPLETREMLRVEAGLPRYGVDIGPNTRITETPYAETVIHTGKGCYIGQEVVSKQRSHASVRKSMVGALLGADEAPPSPGETLWLDERAVGALGRSVYSPGREVWIALATVQSEYAATNHPLEIRPENAPPRGVSLTPLPLVTATMPEDRARALYHRACDLVAERRRDDEVCALLHEALLLVPDLEDAYEMLGVVLHQNGRTADACEVMEALAALNPRCPMAHTNLSVFYAALGRIQDAEREKTQAAALRFTLDRENQRTQKEAEAEQARIQADTVRRLEMFKEVLAIDADDLLANFGSGSALLRLNRAAEAEPFLRKAVAIDKHHSAAHQLLAQCLELLGKREEAIEVLRRGIAAATRRGEFMPLREMEQRLQRLTGAA